ncbi:U2 small nuclear ribonucleoprotein auxiliary factor 35 kDa subunit-related protein 2 isoform X2 [Hydra vulgaris]|nr:U2 small nuclear ribonucleoprotein auxiliary factor 35 kDa subunit-related protein 2 isoform X2 [Hydra vulgaris]XP_047130442.1 U2 small nuclear ribonucleoprotein auxiliary factor 35 kDa subunit-related protein 2 isoform X2 [Hydra vulgaris]
MRRRDMRQDYARKKEKEEAEEERKKAEDDYYKVQLKVEAKRKEEEDKENELKREKDHQDWMVREKDAIVEIKKKKEEEEEKLKIKEEREQKIKEEWEEKESADKEAKERQEEKDELLNKEMNNLKQQHSHSNPEQPRSGGNHDRHNSESFNQSLANTNWNNVSSDMFGTEMDPRNCKFYIKTGACRFGPRCSRIHLKFDNSPTILIQNFFTDARLAIPMLNERNNDFGLEYDEVDLIHEFEKFYDDVIGEFRAAGTVVMFKCCQNYVPHLRGNVYVQYQDHNGALRALKMFNGRWYAGRQLSVELSPVTNWKSSICGLFDKRLCPRGKACNFLHVFRNPGNAYSVPNRTDFDPERATKTGGYDPKFVNPNHPVFAYYSKRDSGYGYRREDALKHDYSKSSTSSHRRSAWDSTRSRSRSRDRDYKRKSKRSHSRSRSRSRSSRSHSRSRSRSRRHKRSHSRSRTRSRSRSRSHSKEHKRSRRDSRGHSKSSNSSRESNRSKRSKRGGSKSSTSTEWSDLSDDPV